ncbi:unnamed protein product [Parascedosporium putredinis]|uniref:NLE domain-containing protein n=1 Tax=Parascedosporium putredinis TaxID=1442378 RepID=A0A9P1GTR0_9PEZI|nr:unnamed protein product [Parascedosporium putredinis]CAI7987472.1 unnamed protein product [Parascedosporium putredinis]
MTTIAQVKVVFTTKHTDVQLPEEKRQLVVPSDIKRYGLSQILNHEDMLDTSSPIPFDFLINGSFLKGTIAEHLERNGISLEGTVTLDYDWVSDVDVLSASAPAAAALLAKDGGEFDVAGERLLIPFPTKIVSAGIEGTVLVWEYSEAAGKGSLKPVLELCAHADQIRDISVHHASGKFLTAASDGRVGLWTASRKLAPAHEPEEPARPAPAKRVKSSVRLQQRGPLALANVSDKPVTAAIFHPLDPSIAYASSMDGSSASTTSVMTLRGHIGWVESVSAAPGNEYSLASGSWDSTCKIWDLRSVRAGTKEEGGGRVCDEAVYTIPARPPRTPRSGPTATGARC